MAGSVVVEQSTVSVVPGEMGTCSVRIRNTGAVVDQFTLTVLGQPAAWTTVVPAALSLFPNADGVVELHFAPPRAPGVGAGPTPFGVRVVGSEDPDNPVVEEGEVDLLPFVDVTAKVTPRTSETKRKAKHDVVLDNKGNTPVQVTLAASDPDEQLAFDLKEPTVTVEAGQSRHVALRVAARKGFARGADKHRPFQVVARPEGGAFPLTMDANLIQKAGLPRFVVPLLAGAVALALIAAVVPGMLAKDGRGGGIIDLANNDAPTTTAAPVAEEEGEDPNAAATPEEAAAAAAAELAANGKDGTEGSGGGSSGGGGDTGGDTSAAGTGGTSAAGTGSGSGSNTGGETTGVTSPSATTAPAPAGGGSPTTTAAGGGGGGGTTATTAAGGSGGSSGTTTTTGQTTTTAPAKSTASKFHGPWATADGSSKMTITVGSSMSVSAGGSVGSFNCIGSVSDAEDGSFTAGKCSDGQTRTISYLSTTDQVRVTTATCEFCRATTFTFNRN